MTALEGLQEAVATCSAVTPPRPSFGKQAIEVACSSGPDPELTAAVAGVAASLSEIESSLQGEIRLFRESVERHQDKVQSLQAPTEWRFALKDVFAILLSAIALTVSFINARSVKRQQQQFDALRSIANQYSEFREFNQLRLSHPEQSHLLELPQHYAAVKCRVSHALRFRHESERAAYLLKERAVAILVFSMYESVLYRYGIAKAEESMEREKFLEEVLGYFHSAWLRNPRLVYLWRDEELSALFEESTCNELREKVLSSNPQSDPQSAGAAVAIDAEP